MGRSIVRAFPSALPVGINPVEKSARKRLLCIAVSSAVRADYVAENGATQMVNGCALWADLRRKPARIALRQAGNRPAGAWAGRLKATPWYRDAHAIGKRGMISN
jgi:hypothetical protein